MLPILQTGNTQQPLLAEDAAPTFMLLHDFVAI
jgi:hypothetical protein